MDWTALTDLHARLAAMGFQGDARQVGELLEHANSEALQRRVTDYWMKISRLQGRFAAAVLAHAHKRQLNFSCESMSDLRFSGSSHDTAVRIAYVEISLHRFRLGFVRGDENVGHMYFNWEGLCLEWVSHKAEMRMNNARRLAEMQIKNDRRLKACS